MYYIVTIMVTYTVYSAVCSNSSIYPCTRGTRCAQSRAQRAQISSDQGTEGPINVRNSSYDNTGTDNVYYVKWEVL